MLLGNQTQFSTEYGKISFVGGVLKDNYYGIRLQQSGSVIKNVTLQNVTLKSNQYSVYDSSAHISMDGCSISGGNTAIYGRYSQTVTVKNSQIESCSYGIRNSYYQGTSRIELENCVLKKLSYVFYYNNNSWRKLAVFMRRCTLVENYQVVYQRYYYNNNVGTSMDVTECNIYQTRYVAFEFNLYRGNTYKLTFRNNTFVGNSRRIIRISKEDSFGTLKSSVLLHKNVFVRNHLSLNEPLIDYYGMGIGTLFSDVSDNVFTENKCSFVIKVDVRSNQETGMLSFQNNTLENNVGLPSNSEELVEAGVRSYSVGLFGCLPNHYNFQYNVFDNKLMEKEMLIGRPCSTNYRPEMNLVEAVLNYWGVSSTDKITERIFHFDNWNDRPRIQYLPAAATRNFTSLLTVAVLSNLSRINGYVTFPLRLVKAYSPYVVSSDVTIPENVTLDIEPGVQLYFKPNIGLLVFGNVVALGNVNEPIKFCSFTYKCKFPVQPRIRLVGGDKDFRGELEILVGHEWHILCYRYFDSRDATVACRELGYGKYFRYWTRYNGNNRPVYNVSFNCRGYETSLSSCKNHTVSYCRWSSYTVNLACERSSRWGNIRIASFANSTKNYSHKRQSLLRNVVIEHNGYLHEKNVPSVQVIGRSPSLTNVDIIDCKGGIEIIGQRDTMVLENIRVENSLTFPGIFIVGNKGSLSISRASITEGMQHGVAIAPIRNMTLPQSYVAQHDLCDPVKTIYVESKLVVSFSKWGYYGSKFCALEVVLPNNTMINFRVLSWIQNSQNVRVIDSGRNSTITMASIYDSNSHRYIDEAIQIPSNSLIIEADQHSSSSPGGFLADITVINETGKMIFSNLGAFRLNIFRQILSVVLFAEKFGKCTDGNVN